MQNVAAVEQPVEVEQRVAVEQSVAVEQRVPVEQPVAVEQRVAVEELAAPIRPPRGIRRFRESFAYAKGFLDNAMKGVYRNLNEKKNSNFPTVPPKSKRQHFYPVAAV